ncbi:MAG: helix-turn-helix domain-containing protein [Christensenellales bacterium]
MKAFFSSIFFRYLLSYAAIMTVLLSGVTIYMNRYYYNEFRSSAISQNINTLSRIRYENESNISTMITIGNQMALSPYIAPFRFEENPENAYHLKKQIALYSVTTNFFDRLYLIFDQDDYIYSASTSVHIDMFLEEALLYEGTSPQELRSMIRDPQSLTIIKSQNVESILLSSRNAPMVTVMVPLGISRSQSLGTLVFMVEESRYQELFSDEIYYEHNTYIIFDGQVMAGSREIPLPDEIVLESMGNDEAGPGAQVSELSYDGADYLLISLGGHALDMRYGICLPLSGIIEGLRDIRLRFNLFMFALSIPCLFLTYYFSRRNYRPIWQLSHLFTAEARPANEFAAIESGIRDLFRRNTDLHDRLGQSISVQRSDFVKNFAKGKYADRKECIKSAEGLGLSIDRRFFAIALIGMESGGESQCGIDELAELCADKVTGYGVEVISLDQLLFTIFSDDEKMLLQWAESAHERLDYQTAISISGSHESFAQASQAYLEAATAFDYRFVMGVARVLRFEDLPMGIYTSLPSLQRYTNLFRQALHLDDMELVSKAIDDLLNCLRGTGMSLLGFRLIYNEIIGTLLSEYLSMSDESVDPLQIYDVFTLSSCHSIDALDGMLRNICRELMEKKSAEKQLGAYPLMQSIIKYMNERFADPNLNISAIADEFGISSVRLSLEFKEIIGMNPSEYLLLLRMEKSKSLLAGTDMCIKDIAAAVGYYDASGFIRRFRRQFAMTPLHYRRSVNEGREYEDE